jgi:hypothetical protein
MTMFKVFAAPPWTDLGPNLLIVSIVLLLVGFWSIGIATSDEILNEYTSCGYNQAPLVLNGRWFDRTPCLDQKTDGLPGWHPFVGMVLFFNSCYVAGGVLSFMASLIYTGLSSGFPETMMNERMGQYLITLQDIPFKVRLPFPPSTVGLRQ